MKELFLVAFYTKKPRQHVNTSQAGWMGTENNYQYDERVEFTRGLKKRDTSMAGVILNLHTKTVVKNTFNPSQRDFALLFKYFLEGYPQQAVQAMADMDPEYLEQFLPKSEPETTPE
jgi:hypothetical protein